MHQTLRIPEILLNIFGHCAPPTILPLTRHGGDADLAVLARTCRTFKEPALDVLWEELDNLSPLVRCLPEACRLAGPTEKPTSYRLSGDVECYMFSRLLKEAERDTLRSYARRVRFIHASPMTPASINEETMRLIFSLAPFNDPLFPRLRSLSWREAFGFTPFHVAVPSLTAIRLDFRDSPYLPISEFLAAFGYHQCPHIEKFGVTVGVPSLLEPAISRQICHWPNLRHVHCYGVALDARAILHLSSIPTLAGLAFTLQDEPIRDIFAHVGSILVFSSLTYLHIGSRPLDTITPLLLHFRLPAAETLCVTTFRHTSKRAIQGYWTAVQEACASDIVTCLQLRGKDQRTYTDLDLLLEEASLCLTLDDLRPCTAFTELRDLHIAFDCPVSLTDADLLELALPRMEELLINDNWGWQIGVDGGGITLSGLAQLLRRCPSLHCVSLAIDTRTFTEIPEELDVSFPARRRLEINFVDSYILPEFVPGLVSVFTALELDPSFLAAWETCLRSEHQGEFRDVWQRALCTLRIAVVKCLSPD